jgi:predicted enzyme related to lactoylglutathione lyase
MNDQMTEKEFVAYGTEIYVSDIEASVKFYQDVLGFNLIRRDLEHNFASFEFHGAVFMMEQHPVREVGGRGVLFRFIIPDVNSYYQEVQSKGANITKPLKKMFYGLTRFYVEDPDGYQLKFCSK